MTDDVKELRRTIRKQKAALVRLTNVILLAEHAMDETVAHRRDIPRDLSSFLGNWTVILANESDKVRYFVLGVDHWKDNKAKIVAKLRAANSQQGKR